ncbi:protein kinase [candidate division KSB1 bacterium]|nr:protein kinase [candidate division KSB1 bacterium]
MNTTSTNNPFVVGQWVRGEKFFGRAEIIAELLFGPRQAVWVAALRRMGKTSLLREVERRVLQNAESNFLALYWDLEGAIDDITLRESLLAAVEESASGLRVETSWENLSTPEVLRKIQQKAKSRQRAVLLLCDEAEALLTVAQNDSHLLARLRRALQSENVRCVLTATRRLTVLETFDEAGTSPFLQGFVPPLYLPPLRETEIQPLLAQAGFSLETRKELFQRSGGHPFLLQLLAKRTLEYGDLAGAYQHLQHDETLHNFFTVDFNTLQPTEKSLLQQCAQGDGLSLRGTSNTEARVALQTLLALGLLAEQNDHLRVRLPLFQDWLQRQSPPQAAQKTIFHSEELKPGERVGPYEILHEIARGGMGIVYCARDVHLQRLAAVKVLHAELLGDEQHRARFLSEARAAAQFQHPHVATIYAIEFKGETPCLCMEHVEGQRLEQWAKQAHLTFAQKLTLAQQIASALAAAHAAGLIHRDLKPSNIMVRKDGMAKLLDFGIARRLTAATRLTRTGQMLGTLAYMSPEQASNLEADARSDVFSFGVVLYELFTGKPAFTAENELALAYSIINENPPPPDAENPALPHALAELLMSMLAKPPQKRPANGQAVSKILEELIELL